MPHWLKILIWIVCWPVGIAAAPGVGIWLKQDWLFSVPVVIFTSLTTQGVVGFLLFERSDFWSF